MEKKQGLIVRVLGGFYSVESEGAVYECRARGVFRRENISPVTGDQVIFELTEEGKGYVMEILPRKNFLVRPPLANLDQLFLVVSAAVPPPNLLVVDKMTAICEKKGIEPVLIFTKSDLADTGRLLTIYRKAGFSALSVSGLTGEGREEVLRLLRGKKTAFSGNSGVGKSTLLNLLNPALALETAQISEKLGRGRHTTRHVELYPLEGGYVADTPGFSAIDLQKFEVILKEDLQDCFREMRPYQNRCQFRGCSHTVEQGCAVLEALERGEIPLSRHESYCTLYHSVKDLKEWEVK